MPTLPKLVAAVFFTCLCWFIGDLIKPLLPEGKSVTWLSPGLAAIGLVTGWRFTGDRIGSNKGGAIGIGITTAVILMFWGLLAFSGYEMIQRSLRIYYEGPVEAIQGMVFIALEYAVLIATPEIMATLFGGSVFGGWLTSIVPSAKGIGQ